MMRPTRIEHSRPWWHDAVVYQIYPRSFQDSNADGVGDIQGIIDRLDHLVWLGVNTIWLSPVFRSPQEDGGYDISDYCAIDPLFGSMSDMERLIAAVHDRGMRIILDGVFNHTSSQHPWFQNSVHQRNEQSDWYIWRQQPNNWQSAFGGSAWTYSPVRGAYYLHTFASSQPDLNWANPEVQDAILTVQRFWYQKGIDGFRLDVFNAYCKDQHFRDNPRRQDPIGWLGGLVYGYVRHDHIYDRDRPELFEVLSAFRALADEFDTVLIGETLDERFKYARATDYVGEQSLQLAFNFAPLHSRWNRLPDAIRMLSNSMERPAWVWSNHDFPRQSARWGNPKNRSKVMTLFQCMLRGVPVIYYGEEIDVQQGHLSRSEIVDPVGRRFFPFYKGRDGARFPMPWGDKRFSEGRSWLPERSHTSVELQLADPTSCLHWMRMLLEVRQQYAACRYGDIEWCEDGFYRRLEDQRLRVIVNLTRKTRPLPAECMQGKCLAKIEDGDMTTLLCHDAGVWIV